MHIRAERFVFFSAVMLGGFWKREPRPIKWTPCRLLTPQLLFCPHICSLWLIQNSWNERTKASILLSSLKQSNRNLSINGLVQSWWLSILIDNMFKNRSDKIAPPFFWICGPKGRIAWDVTSTASDLTRRDEADGTARRRRVRDIEAQQNTTS